MADFPQAMQWILDGKKARRNDWNRPDYVADVIVPGLRSFVMFMKDGSYGGKGVENRSPGALRHMKLAGVERLAIHASKGMTRAEYEEASDFMAETFGLVCPPARDLIRGAIIGSVAVRGVVKASASKWFTGPQAIVLADPRPCDPAIAAVGQLGLFEWKHDATVILPPLARWMVADLYTPPAPTPELQLED